MYEVEARAFAQRRRELMERLGPNGVAVIFGEPERTRSNDTDFPYRPASDILYLTGFREPGCVLVLAPGHPDGEFVMFVRPRDLEAETWNGRRFGIDGVKSEFGADVAFDIHTLDTELPKFLSQRETVFWPLGVDSDFDGKMFRHYTALRSVRRRAPENPTRLADVRDLVHEMRLFKHPEEIDLMRRAGRITSEAHVAAMRATRPGLFEYEIQAVIESYFRRHGGDFPAYTSIVGTGDNATILHYTENRSAMKDGEVVLIDAGCEYHFYAADITRTWPVSGKFTGAQRDAYQAVLDAQMAAIADIAPGLPYNELQERCVRRLVQSLRDLKVLDMSVDEAIETEAYKRYYPHSVGHWLGIDVHDVGNYFAPDRHWRRLEPGMVLTIEPGLYFPAHDERVPVALRGVGIRIEDDILVTAQGHENLTHACPKTVSEIEAIVGQGI